MLTAKVQISLHPLPPPPTPAEADWDLHCPPIESMGTVEDNEE